MIGETSTILLPMTRTRVVTHCLRAVLGAGLLLPAAMPAAAQVAAPVAGPMAAPAQADHLDVPDNDDGLPGRGPIRRYAWFRKLWHDKRAAWAVQTAQDQGAVVLLGDSITQGWNELVVTVRGGAVSATCNGEPLDVKMTVPPSGPIGLEGDRGQMEYRRIRVSATVPAP